MGIELWLAFSVALLVALAVPGPDLVIVVHSATRSLRTGISTAAGIITGLSLHALLAAAGATALLLSVPGALSLVQALGAGVLLWMGGSMFWASLNRRQEVRESVAPQTRGGYIRGFITNVTNPKALLFFAAILPQFIGEGEGAALRTVILCTTAVLSAVGWWALVIVLIQFSGFNRLSSADRIITFLGGISVLIIGAGLLVSTVYGIITLGT